MDSMLAEEGSLKQMQIELVNVVHLYCTCLFPTFC
jgi:hypothetical protein